MLARRFAFVCLAAALAGGTLAMLIQESARSSHTWKSGTLRACPDGFTADCLRLLN